jgi:hypothetical protein
MLLPRLYTNIKSIRNLIASPLSLSCDVLRARQNLRNVTGITFAKAFGLFAVVRQLTALWVLCKPQREAQSLIS